MATRMHQTTVRFAADLWEQLEEEAARSGVSAAQYVRDATLARLAFTAGQRSADGEREFAFGRTASTIEESTEIQSGSAAVWAQARLARERAHSVREQAQALQCQTRLERRVEERSTA